MQGHNGRGSAADAPSETAWLVCRTGSLLLALPLGHVVEVMRPLHVETLADAPDYVLGIAVIRGAPVPVIDSARLVGGRSAQGARLVSLRSADRGFAMVVDAVAGVYRFPPGALEDPPPLLRHMAADVVTQIGLLDAALVVFLGTALVVPESALHVPVAEGSVP